MEGGHLRNKVEGSGETVEIEGRVRTLHRARTLYEQRDYDQKVYIVPTGTDLDL